MKVHLINPPAAGGVDMVREGRCMQRAGAWTAVWAPISLATIAAVLREDGCEVKLDDCIIEHLNLSQLLKRARGFNADLFVLNTATPSIVSDLATADALKREFPGATIIATGIHVTALSEESFGMASGLDAIVLGEPELTARYVARALREKILLAGIPGLAARSGNEIIKGPGREPVALDALPFPAWDFVRRDLHLLPFTNRPFLLLATSRGCPFHCRFCADHVYYGRQLRVKSPERIVAELRHVRDTYSIRDFLFWSESFTLKRDWTVKVLEAIIAADLGVSFVINSRADHVDAELLALLKKAGCWMIGYGFESGSDRVLAMMDKKMTVADNARAARLTHEAGMKVTAHFVVGYPGETREEIEKTIDLARSLPIDFAQFYCAVPFPGSDLYAEAKEKGWMNRRSWAPFEQNFSVIDGPSLKSAEVMDLRRRAYRSFYLRPARIWQALREDVGAAGIGRFGSMLRAFREWW